MLKPLSIALVLICIVNAVMCFVSQNMDGLIGFMMALIFLVTSILLRNELESVVAQAKHKATPPLKTFETLEAGDKLKYKNEEDEDLIVVDFSVLRQVFFLRGAITGQVDLWGQENMKRDLDIIQPPSPEQPVEMTLEEIEKALGKKIKIVESK